MFEYQLRWCIWYFVMARIEAVKMVVENVLLYTATQHAP
jgi:hypothetical protein